MSDPNAQVICLDRSELSERAFVRFQLALGAYDLRMYADPRTAGSGVIEIIIDKPEDDDPVLPAFDIPDIDDPSEAYQEVIEVDKRLIPEDFKCFECKTVMDITDVEVKGDKDPHPSYMIFLQCPEGCHATVGVAMDYDPRDHRNQRIAAQEELLRRLWQKLNKNVFSVHDLRECQEMIREKYELLGYSIPGDEA